MSERNLTEFQFSNQFLLFHLYHIPSLYLVSPFTYANCRNLLQQPNGNPSAMSDDDLPTRTHFFLPISCPWGVGRPSLRSTATDVRHAVEGQDLRCCAGRLCSEWSYDLSKPEIGSTPQPPCVPLFASTYTASFFLLPLPSRHIPSPLQSSPAVLTLQRPLTYRFQWILLTITGFKT